MNNFISIYLTTYLKWPNSLKNKNYETYNKKNSLNNFI